MPETKPANSDNVDRLRASDSKPNKTSKASSVGSVDLGMATFVAALDKSNINDTLRFDLDTVLARKAMIMAELDPVLAEVMEPSRKKEIIAELRSLNDEVKKIVSRRVVSPINDDASERPDLQSEVDAGSVGTNATPPMMIGPNVRKRGKHD